MLYIFIASSTRMVSPRLTLSPTCFSYFTTFRHWGSHRSSAFTGSSRSWTGSLGWLGSGYCSRLGRRICCLGLGSWRWTTANHFRSTTFFGDFHEIVAVIHKNIELTQVFRLAGALGLSISFPALALATSSSCFLISSRVVGFISAGMGSWPYLIFRNFLPVGCKAPRSAHHRCFWPGLRIAYARLPGLEVLRRRGGR